MYGASGRGPGGSLGRSLRRWSKNGIRKPQPNGVAYYGLSARKEGHMEAEKHKFASRRDDQSDEPWNPVCAWCGVYERERRSDGHNAYTVCARCGRAELTFMRRVGTD